MNARVMSMALEDIYPVRYDWARLMKELRQFGWTPYKVALTLCIDPPTAYAWEKEGSEPRHAVGAALIQLHRAVCGTEYSAKLYSDSARRA